MASQRLEFQLGAASSIATSRRRLRQRVDAWGCANVDDMVLGFSELVTNATVHTQGASRALIRHVPPNVRVEVHDSSHAAPVQRVGGRTGGFGLRIVGRLCERWGWEQTDGGKFVWATFGCGHSPPEADAVDQGVS
jgi:two-component sensor histidine kinase